jgi:hypothetical protein
VKALARYIPLAASSSSDLLADFEPGAYDIIVRTGSAGYMALGGDDIDASAENRFVMIVDKEYTFTAVSPGQLFARNLHPDNAQGVGVLGTVHQD